MAKGPQKTVKASKKEEVVEKKTAPAATTTEFKYGVSDIAEALGIEAATVRTKLRAAGVAKAGKSYGWNTQAELKEVIAELRDSDKSEKAEKPAAKGKAAKAEKVAPSKADKAPSKGKKAPKKAAKKDEDEDDDED
jgi:hypothetical protein